MAGESKDSKMERDIFLAAMEIVDAGERDAFLKESCSDDPALLLRIETLLSSRERGDDFLESEPLRAGKEIQDELNRIASGSPDAEGGSSRIPVSGSSAGPWEPPAATVLDPLFSAYTIDSLIGRGGMGAVYRGVQDSLERPVAIKILRPEIAEDESFATRFRREALSMAKLSHPNLVSIIDYGTVAVELEHPTGDVCDGTLYFLVMEFIEGCDLHQLIRSGELEHVTALSMISQICDALEYAHGEGYVHRDIKPANIFVTKGGVVKVGDFGLAKLSGSSEAVAEMSRLTQTGYIMGTPDYMAPEQMESEGVIDHRSDIYSLGVMFYEMLTGKLPRGAFPSPSERIKIDVRIDEVVLKAMQSEPNLRYQHASEVKEDVERLSKENPEPVEPAKKAGKSEAQRTTPRTLAWMGGILLAVALLGAAFFFAPSFANTESDAPPSEIVSRETRPTSEEGADATVPSPSEPKPQSRDETHPAIFSVPTRDFPDISQLPKGRARFWGGEHFGPMDEIQALDSVTDFVEVMIEGDSGWLGLRSNGDVLHWSPKEGIKDHRIGSHVAVMQRSSYQYLGQLLSREGSIVNRTHPDRALALAVPRTGIVDLAKTDHPEYAYSILLSDGSVKYLGSAPGPSPEMSDFVRIEGCDKSTFGIRQSGQLVCWGDTPQAFAELQGIRFVDLTSNTHFLSALADTGEVWLLNSEKVIRLQSLFQTHGPMTEVSSGFQAFAGRRLSDRRWVVWNNVGNEGENLLRVGKIVESLGPNVESLHTAINSAVWIEVEGGE